MAANKSFFKTINKSFVNVTVEKDKDNAIVTEEFLDASRSLITLFDLLGSVAFGPVQSDMKGNIDKIEARRLAAPAESETLQDLVRNEIKSKQHTATEGLVWLVRGLDFTAKALAENLADPQAELSASFRSAYGATLKPHHSFFVKPIFSAAMSACPYRKDFYEKLGGEEDQTVVEAELKAWLTALENLITILTTFLATKEAKW